MDSFMSWIGGKKLLRKKICEEINKTNYKNYIEVFGGAGWVLFYEERKGKNEIYNDYNSELVKLFKCMKYHSRAVKEELSYLLNSREIFEDFKRQYKIQGLTDIQRAARYFFIIKTSFATKLNTFGCAKRNIENITNMFEAIQERLNTVIIENLDFEKLIRLRDNKESIFYCDPPYYKTERYYKNIEFNEEDHLRLNKLLNNIKGKFVLSYNDCDYIKKLYKNFSIISIERFSNITAINPERKAFKEIIIKNF